jgi:hypothetical protein
MIKPSMRVQQSRKRWGVYGGVAAILLAVGVYGTVTIQSVAAEGAWGDSGSGSGATGSYYTTNGFGWKLFDVSSAGPNGGFESGKWGSINDPTSIPGKCHATKNNKVWVHVVREPGGGERSYSYSGADYNRNRPAAGNDPYVFNANGVYEYQGASLQQKVIDIVAVVQGYYLKANPSGAGWGTTIGWFCWSDNPPWTVSVATTVDKSVAEPGETITWTHKITNNGENPTNVDITVGAQNAQGLGSGVATTWKFTSGKAKKADQSYASTYVIPVADFGKRLCRSTTATPGANTGGTATSSEVCTTIAKRPKVQVLGGDLFVGRGSATNPARVSTIITSVTPSGNGRYYGSWAEYAIIPSGTVRGMASGSGYAAGGVQGSLCGNSLLTFANTTGNACNGSQVGRYKTSSVAQDVAARFPVTPKTPTVSTGVPVDIASLLAKTTYTASGGTITLVSSQKIPAGKWVVIHAGEATVRIDQNIEYLQGPFTKEADIPQVAIIAKNILIDDSVTAIDAWLVARGTGSDGYIKTCDAPINEPGQLTANVCDKKLTVNGPVSANHLYMYRTYGALGATASQAGEVFNLRADAYLWASSLDTTAYAQSVRTVELPPRY